MLFNIYELFDKASKMSKKQYEVNFVILTILQLLHFCCKRLHNVI